MKRYERTPDNAIIDHKTNEILPMCEMFHINMKEELEVEENEEKDI